MHDYIASLPQLAALLGSLSTVPGYIGALVTYHCDTHLVRLVLVLVGERVTIIILCPQSSLQWLTAVAIPTVRMSGVHNLIK